MNTVAKCLAPVALIGTIVPPLLFLFKSMGEGPMKLIMLVASVLWFPTAPVVMKGGDE